MSDEQAKIVVDGDVSPLRQKLREAGEDLKRFGADGESAIGRMTGPLGALQSKFVAVGALLAGGSVFKEAVAQAATFTEESMKLGQALGVSASEASTFITALEDIDVSQEEFVGATKAMSKELRNNEADLQAMGLKTRDAAGNLRPLNQLTVEAIEILNGYKSGTDRAVASQVLFGKGFALTSNLTKLNSETLAENAELQHKLGAIVGEENVEAWKAYDAAGDQSHLTLKAINLTIGNALIPVLTELGNWFVAVGPYAVTAFKGAIGGLVALFWGLKFAAETVWNGVAYVIEVVTVKALRFAETAGRALVLDFEGARGAWERGTEQLEEIADKRLKNIMDSAQETRDKLWNLFAEGAPAAGPDGSGKSAGNLVKKDKDKKAKAEADPSYMQYYEAALGERKRLASEEDALREYTKAEELAYWQTLLQYADLSVKDRLSIEKKASDLVVAVRREEAKEKQALDAENASHSEAMALLRIDAEAAAADASVEAGQFSTRERLELEMQFEQRRLEIQRAALEERLQLAERDPNTNPAERARLQHQIEKLEMQHGIKLRGLQSRVAQENGRIWGDLTTRMSSLWDKGIQSLMNGTFRWRNAFKAVGAELVSWFATSVVGEKVKAWMAGKVKELAISLGFLEQEKSLEVVSSAAVIAAKKVEALSEVQANAAVAGTGAAASQASIPIIGPALALAAMATVFGQVSAFGATVVASASRGFDIPKGLNPMTQLHEEEMVLPANIANPLRQQLAGEGAGGQGRGGRGGDTIHVHAMDARSFESYLKKNSHALAPGLRRMARNFTPKGGS